MIINPYAFGGGGGGGDIAATILARSPLAYYKMDEASGTTMTDSSGNGRNGNFASVTLAQPSITPSDSGTCARFPGAGSGQVADAAWQDAATLGFLCAFKLDSVASFQHLIDKDNAGSNGHWLRMNSDGRLEASFRVGGVIRACTSASPLSAATAYIAECSCDGTDVVLYVNGSLVGSATGTPSALSTNGTTLNFGRNGGNILFMTGYMQHAAILDTMSNGTDALATAQAGGFA